jgi:hypothetical protein
MFFVLPFIPRSCKEGLWESEVFTFILYMSFSLSMATSLIVYVYEFDCNILSAIEASQHDYSHPILADTFYILTIPEGENVPRRRGR